MEAYAKARGPWRGTKGYAHALRERSDIAVVGVVPIGGRDAGVWSGETLRCIAEILRVGGSLDAMFRENPRLAHGESPEYTGRAVLHLAVDPDIVQKSGQILLTDDLAMAYGFTDIDGENPPRDR